MNDSMKLAGSQRHSEFLLQRWNALMSSLGLPENTTTREALITAYAEPHRAYHTLTHLDAVLTTLNDALHLARHPCEVELALWFHDAVYTLGSTTNEADSAEWARSFLAQNNAPAEVQTRVTNLILATAHVHTLSEGDDKLISDIDLAILGQPEAVYQRYAEAVRREYAYVPAPVYAEKRRLFLQELLSRPRIYATEHFYERLEQPARRNLTHDVQRLV